MKFVIDMKLPSLNDYTKWWRANKYLGAKKKAHIEAEIGLYLMDMP